MQLICPIYYVYQLFVVGIRIGWDVSLEKVLDVST